MLNNNILRKHVCVIHAYSMLSVLQRKIFNVLLYKAIQVKTDGNHFSKNINFSHESMIVECEMSISELIKHLHYNSNNSQYLKESIDMLASLKIEWNILKDKVPSHISFLNLRVLHGSPTFFQNGTFNFSFHKYMLECVNNPDIYGSIDIDLQADFESKYGHALYENSTRFVNMQKNKIINLDMFRKLLGVDDQKYQSMRELNRNVIKPAVEEVNDRADFIVNLESIRSGRKVTGFELNIKKKNNTITLNQTKVDSIIDTKKEIFNHFGVINSNVLNSILRNYTTEYIHQKISYTKEFAKKNVDGLYPVPYFISALKNDYQSKNLNRIEKCEIKVCKNDFKIWEEKFVNLQLDLNRWKKNLQVVIDGGKNQLIANTEKIVLKCEQALRDHLSQKHLFADDEEGNDKVCSI